jgi:hypothetical protein
MNRLVALACLGLLSGACNRHEGQPRATQAPAPAPVRDARTDEASNEPATNLPPLELALHVEAHHDGLGLRVINQGAERVRLRPEVALEARDAAGQAKPLHPEALRLQRTCQSQGCVGLVQGAEIVAPAWLGLLDTERCGALLVPPGPGRYQLRVRRCDDDASAVVPFEWPAHDR